MRAGERKARAVVIKVGRSPGSIAVTGHAILRIIVGHVIGIGGTLIIRLVAREAILGRAGEAAIDMAQAAFYRRVRAEQRKTGAIVIKTRGTPGMVLMAKLAILGKIAGHMIRIRSALEIRLMA